MAVNTLKECGLRRIHHVHIPKSWLLKGFYLCSNTGTIPRVKVQEGRKAASSLYGDDKDRSSNGTPLALNNRNIYF